jgi:hypothetical protein
MDNNTKNPNNNNNTTKKSDRTEFADENNSEMDRKNKSK